MLSSRVPSPGTLPMMAAVAAVLVLAVSIPTAAASGLVHATRSFESYPDGGLQVTRHGRELGSAAYCPTITFPSGGYTLTPGTENSDTIATVTAVDGTTLADCHFSGIPEGATLKAADGSSLTITYGEDGTATGHFAAGCTSVTIIMTWVPTEGKYTLGMKFTDNKGNSVTGTLTITIGSGYGVKHSPPPPVNESPPITTSPECPTVAFPSGGWDMSTVTFTETIVVTSASTGADLDSCHFSGLPEGATLTVKETNALVITYGEDGTASGKFAEGCLSVTIVFKWTPTEADIKAGITVILKLSFVDSHGNSVTGSLTCSAGGGGVEGSYPEHSPSPPKYVASPSPPKYVASPSPPKYVASPSPPPPTSPSPPPPSPSPRPPSPSPPPPPSPSPSPPPPKVSPSPPPPTSPSPPPPKVSPSPPPPTSPSPPPPKVSPSPPPPTSPSPPPPTSPSPPPPKVSPSPPPPTSPSPPPPKVSSPPPPAVSPSPPPVVFEPPMCSFPTPGTVIDIDNSEPFSATVATTSAAEGAVIATVGISGIPAGATFTSDPCAVAITYGPGGTATGVFSGTGCESVKLVLNWATPAVGQYTLSFDFKDSNGENCASSLVINVTPSTQSGLPPAGGYPAKSPSPPPPTVGGGGGYPAKSPSPPPPTVGGGGGYPAKSPSPPPPTVSSSSPPPSDHMNCYAPHGVAVIVVKAKVTFHGAVAVVSAAPGTKITTCGISGIPEGATLHSKEGDMEVSYGHGGTATGVFSGEGCDTATIMMDWTPTDADIGVEVTIEIFFLDSHHNDCTVKTPMECDDGMTASPPAVAGSGSEEESHAPPPPVVSGGGGGYEEKHSPPPPVVSGGGSGYEEKHSPPPPVVSGEDGSDNDTDEDNESEEEVEHAPPSPAVSGGGYPTCPSITFPQGGWNPSLTVFTKTVVVTAAHGSTLSSCHITGIPEGGVITSTELVITYDDDGTAIGEFLEGCTKATIVFTWEPTAADHGRKIMVTMSFEDSNHGTATATMWCKVSSYGGSSGNGQVEEHPSGGYAKASPPPPVVSGGGSDDGDDNDNDGDSDDEGDHSTPPVIIDPAAPPAGYTMPPVHAPPAPVTGGSNGDDNDDEDNGSDDEEHVSPPAVSGGGGYASSPPPKSEYPAGTPVFVVGVKTSVRIVIKSSGGGVTLTDCDISGLPEHAELMSPDHSVKFVMNADGSASGEFSEGCTYATIVLVWTPTAADVGKHFTVTITFKDSNGSSGVASLPCEVESDSHRKLLAGRRML